MVDSTVDKDTDTDMGTNKDIQHSKGYMDYMDFENNNKFLVLDNNKKRYMDYNMK